MIKRTLKDFLDDGENNWRQIPADLMRLNGPGGRAPEELNAGMDQFNITSARRYQPRIVRLNGKTQTLTACNIFLSDATTALNAQIPHWIDAHGKAAYANTVNRETTANEIYDRLLAGVDGYTECTPDVALAKALLGHPVVVAWRNPSGPGHVGLVEPVSDARGILVAQAGAVCGRRIPLRAAFGDRAVRMFWHE